MSLPVGDVKDSPTDADLYEVGTGDLVETTLAADITDTSPGVGEVLELTSTTNLPTNGFLLVKTTEEIIRYEGISTSPVGVTVKERGFGSTSAVAASSGDAVWLVDASYYHDLLAAYIQRLMSEHNADGSHGDMTVTGNIVQGDGKYIQTDEIRARDADGLKLYDDGGNGVFVYDGGYVKIKSIDTTTMPILILENTENNINADAGIRFTTDGVSWCIGVESSSTIDSFQIRQHSILGPNPTLVLEKDTGNIGIGTGSPDCKCHIDTETTTATDVVFQIESDVTNADTVKARIEADGEFFSDIGFTTFSPVVAADPDEALDQALADATKPHKPYKGLFPFADLTELAAQKDEAQSRLEEVAQRIKETESEIAQLEKDIAKEPDSERKAELEERLAILQETLKAHNQDKRRYTKRLAVINHWEQIAEKHGLKGRADERERWGRDPTRIAMGVALWAEAARQKIAELEAKVAQLEAKLAAQGA